jgi:metal-sulfur cluster biosynthetic enzyme
MKKLLLFSLLCLTLPLAAQQLENFSLVNVTNNQKVGLDTYPSCSGIVIIFTSNACPYDEYYRARIKKMSAELQDKVPVLLVNSNQEPAESIENMKAKARQLNLSVPYLADKDQVLMQRLGATKNPQAFLLKNVGGKFSVVYTGAIDDNAQVEGDVKQAYLKDAIDIMLANQKIATPEIRPAGCTIRKK